MKNIYKSILAIAAAVVTISCSQEVIENAPASNESKVVSFKAVQPETKVSFGEASGTKYPALWTESSTVKIAQNFATAVEATVTPSSDGKNADFSVELTDDKSGSYTFYAISPSSAVVSGVNSNNYYYNVEIPTSQTSDGNIDENAIIIAATSETLGEFPEEPVELQFSHVTSYVKMTITNLTADSEVDHYVVTSSQNIAYRYYYYVSGENAGNLVENSGQKSISIAVTDGATKDVWFACAPITAKETLEVKVYLKDGSTYTKTITVPSDLDAGMVGIVTIDFSGIEKDEDVEYTLVTSWSDLGVGDEVLILSADDNFAIGAIASGSGGTSIACTPENKVVKNPSGVIVFTLEKGSASGSYAFGYTVDGEKRYFSANSTTKNKASYETSISAESSWKADGSFDSETGAVQLIGCGTGTYNYLRCNPNNGSPLFRTYASGSSVSGLVALYHRGTGTSSEEEEEEVKTDHEGTVEDPYSVSDVLTLMENGKNDESEYVYVSGIISQIDEVSTSYGNATYYISDDGTTTNQYEIFRGLYLGNVKFTEEDQIEVGDKVVIYGRLITYNGTYEMASGNYIYSLNGEEMEVEEVTTTGDGTVDNPYTAEDATNLVNAGQTPTNVYIKGIISQIESVSTSYGNANFYISEDGTTTSTQFYIWRAYYLEKAKFTSEDQIAVGDEVVIYGNLKSYNGTPETDSGAYIYSLN